MVETYEQHSKTKLLSIIVAVIVIAGLVLVIDRLKNGDSDSPNPSANTSLLTSSDSTSTTTPSPSTVAQTSTSNTSTSSSSYKDGTYSATSQYFVPHGQEAIKVNLTIKDGTVSDVSIQNSESDRDSAEYQQAFTDSYRSQVVGKKLSGLQISVVSGASDTTQGFNDALSQIANQAQS